MSKRLAVALRSRIRSRNRSERGLTIIELLVSLTLLILIAGSLAGGMQMFRRAFEIDQRAQVAAEAGQAIDIIAGQIAAAFPLVDTRSGRMTFDGRPTTIQFSRLDQGRANRGGVQQAFIRQTGDDLTITLTSAVQDQNAVPSESLSPIVLLSGISQVQFSYFGTVGQSGRPAWRADWSAMDQLPELVSIRVGYKDLIPGATVLVALRQH